MPISVTTDATDQLRRPSKKSRHDVNRATVMNTNG
jgi:hypothetical protein